MKLRNFLRLHKIIWVWYLFTKELFVSQLSSNKIITKTYFEITWDFEEIIKDSTEESNVIKPKF